MTGPLANFGADSPFGENSGGAGLGFRIGKSDIDIDTASEHR